MLIRISKAVLLLILAAAVGFAIGLVRPRRVVSRGDLHEASARAAAAA